MTLLLEGVTIAYEGRTLAEVGKLHLHAGRPVTIVGESGSGKSLLAHAIMGTLAANLDVRGRLTVNGTAYDVADRANRRRLWGRQLALLAQEPVLALDPTMRVIGQVMEGSAGYPHNRREARLAAERLLDRLGVGRARHAYPHTLSGGMAQRVAFAAATIGGAAALIADEPSKGLDAAARTELVTLLRRHLESSGILLTITHDLDLARELGGDVLVMRDSSIVEQGPTDVVLSRPEDSYTRRLLAAAPSSWSHRWMREQPKSNEGPVLVAAEGVTKSFNGHALFADISITIRGGERLSLSGPSGCGKTTLGNILLRLVAPDSGRVRHATEIGGGRVQKLYQDPALAFPPHVTLADSFGDLLRRHRLSRERLGQWIESMRLPSTLLGRHPTQVSGGELQRLAIVRAMLMEPALLFADEPTSRLDLLTQEETMSCLMAEVAQRDCALVLITHDDELAAAVSDRRIDLVDARRTMTTARSLASVR